jgi:hypothetical protein
MARKVRIQFPGANSDNTPQVLFNNFNRAGSPREISDGSGTTTLKYDHANRLVSATTDGASLLPGLTVTNHFHNLGRREALLLRQPVSAGCNLRRIASCGASAWQIAVFYPPSSTAALPLRTLRVSPPLRPCVRSFTFHLYVEPLTLSMFTAQTRRQASQSRHPPSRVPASPTRKSVKKR